MRRSLIVLTPGALAGCTTRFNQVMGHAFGLFVGFLTIVSIVGLIGLWRTLRALRQPDGYSIMGSVTALLVPALPLRFIIPILDAEPQWRTNAAVFGLILYFLFVFVCFILSVVRWTRTWRFKD